MHLEARTSVVGNRDDDGSGAGIKMARVEDIQEGEQAGPMTEETGGGGGAIWMTPRFLLCVTGWTTVSWAEMGIWETEQTWDR